MDILPVECNLEAEAALELPSLLGKLGRARDAVESIIAVGTMVVEVCISLV